MLPPLSAARSSVPLPCCSQLRCVLLICAAPPAAASVAPTFAKSAERSGEVGRALAAPSGLPPATRSHLELFDRISRRGHRKQLL